MSEPLSSHEIEDVLSSIRRLVSEELRPAPRARTAAAPDQSAAEPEKLILTPSLRVVGDSQAAPEARAEDGAAEAPVETLVEAAVDPVLLHEGLSAIAEPAAIEPAPIEPATAGPAPVFRAGGPLIEGADDLVWAAPGEPEVEAAWAEEPEPWQDGEATDAAASVRVTPFPSRAGTASDPLARAWADRAEAELRQELDGISPPLARDGAAEDGDLTETGSFGGEAAVIDEEALRDIVREIIREELAGSLGERITRNVRKLVRIEINRSRAAREFD
ncbi:MAG: hypothetical protein IAE87_14530 [Rhodobacteraceae bacterium]|jgi:hypothetical protein|nr:hypothetical protein [Paracoccaceae bacterium]